MVNSNCDPQRDLDLSLVLPPIDKTVLQDEIRREKRSRLFLVIFTITGLILSSILGWKAFTFLSQEIYGTSEDTSMQSTKAKDEILSQTSDMEPIEKIAYIYMNNVWIYDLEAKQSAALTQDGSVSINYDSPVWKDSEDLTYVRCTSEGCSILTVNTTSLAVQVEAQIQSIYVDGIRWSHDGKTLAYLYYKDNNFHLDLRGDESRQIAELPSIAKQDLNLNDALYVRFSPDDSKILVVDTFAKEGNMAIVALDITGNEIFSVKQTSDSKPSFGFFMSNDIIYYKNGADLYLKSFESGEEAKVTDRIVDAFNIEPSPDRKSIIYWTYSWQSGIATLWSYDIANDTIRRIIDGNAFPVWIDNVNIAAIDIGECVACSRGSISMLGVNLINVNTKEPTKLIDTIGSSKVGASPI